MPQTTQEKEQTIYDRIAQYEREFLDMPITIAGNYTFSQIKTIKRAHLYYASQFESGSGDKLGEKTFFNILKPRVKNAAKNIDLDSKDINVKSKTGKQVYKSWFLRREIEEFNRKRMIGQLFNEMVIKTPKYGSYVMKRVYNEKIIMPVDLRNIQNDPTSDCLKESWVNEIHYYTPAELRKMKSWDQDKVSLAIKSYRTYKTENYADETMVNIKKGSAQYIKVYEHYDWVEKKEVYDNSDSTDLVLGQFIVILPASTKCKAGASAEGLTLFKTEVTDVDKNYPYKEVHYDRVEGRWLGCGMMEDGFDLQVFKNEQINQMKLAMKLANLIFYVTNDQTFSSNILTDVITGDVLTLKGRLERVSTEVRNFGGNTQVTNEIENLVNSLMNSFEVTTGEAMPSGTPLGLAQMLNQNANKWFEFVRERLGLFIEDVYNNWIMPELAKKINKQHIIEMSSEQEVAWLKETIINAYTWEAIKNIILSAERKPTNEEVQLVYSILRQKMKDKKSLYFDVPDGFYKDWQDEVEVYVTDERINKQERIQTYNAILQMMGANQAIIQSPMFKKLLDVAGISDADMPVAQTAPAVDMNSPAQGQEQGNVAMQ